MTGKLLIDWSRGTGIVVIMYNLILCKCVNSSMLILVIISAGYSDEMLELVLVAMEDLRESLKDQGSNLMIRFGSAENVIREIVKEVVTY